MLCWSRTLRGITLASLFLWGGHSPSLHAGEQIFRRSGSDRILVGEVVREIRTLGSGTFSEAKLVAIRLPSGEEREVVLKRYRMNRLKGFAGRHEIKTEFPFQAAYDLVTPLFERSTTQHIRAEWGGLVMEGAQESYVTLSEYMDGSLKTLMDRMPLTPGEELPLRVRNLHLLMEDGTKALSELQEASLTHGDIKPENIMYRDIAPGERRFYLSDLDGVQLTGKSPRMFTPSYAPPEFLNRSLNLRSVETDLFSLANTLYRSAFGGASPTDAFLSLTPQGRELFDSLAKSAFRADMRLKLLLEAQPAGEANSPYTIIQTLFAENRRLPPNSPGWSSTLLSAEQHILGEGMKRIYANPQTYLQMLHFIDTQFEELAGHLAADAPERTQLQELRQFIRFGLSREPAARIQAFRIAHRPQSRLPVQRRCVWTYADLYRQGLQRLLSSPEPPSR